MVKAVCLERRVINDRITDDVVFRSVGYPRTLPVLGKMVAPNVRNASAAASVRETFLGTKTVPSAALTASFNPDAIGKTGTGGMALKTKAKPSYIISKAGRHCLSGTAALIREALVTVLTSLEAISASIRW
jgi:hypothetical protein